MPALLTDTSEEPEESGIHSPCESVCATQAFPTGLTTDCELPFVLVVVVEA